MIEKPKLLLLVILITLSGIFGIYAYAVLIEAKTASIADLSSKDLGSLVEVEGHIKEVSMWKEGDLNLVLVDYESGKTIDIIVESEAVKNLEHQEKLIPGAKVKVNGLVEDYKGYLQINVRSSEGVTLLQTAQSNTLLLEVILERPEVFQGVLVVVRGNVWDIEEIESINAFTFTLQNSTEGRHYSVNCIVFNITDLVDRDNMRIQSGDEIILTGIFEYYVQKGVWQIQSYEGKESLEKID
jgi:DNA/RNA endonuclease YhcR with UshA esterase domain